jgi:diguanylate cyclase (GGDEF)-like protein
VKRIVVFFQKAIQPQSTGEVPAYHEHMVRIILMMVFITLIPITMLVTAFYLAGVLSAQPLCMTLGMDAGIAACWFLVSRGWWQAAGYLTVLSFYILAAIGSFLNGLNTAVVLTYAILVLLVAMFSESRGSWIVVTISVLTHSLLGSIHSNEPFNVVLVSAVVVAFTLTGVALLQWLATHLLKTSLAEERSIKEKMSQEIDERKQLEMQLHFWGLHDALTGLYNRFYFEAELERLQYSRLYPISIVMADLDGLKHINDTFGHAFGDLMLKAVARVLRETFRAEDLVARIGGDEFAVLLTQTDEEAIQAVGRRLQENLAQYNRQCPEQVINLSVGMATAQKGMPLTQVLKLADDRMYAEKWGKKLDAPRENVTSYLESND